MTQGDGRAVIGTWDIELGRVVRETWVAWAKEQPDPKPSWLVGWDELDEGQCEVDIRIGRAVAERCAEKRYPGRGEDYVSAGPCEACGSDLDDEGWCEWCQPNLS